MTIKLVIAKFSETEFSFAVIEPDGSITCHGSDTETLASTVDEVRDFHSEGSFGEDTELDFILYKDKPYEIVEVLETIEEE